MLIIALQTAKPAIDSEIIVNDLITSIMGDALNFLKLSEQNFQILVDRCLISCLSTRRHGHMLRLWVTFTWSSVSIGCEPICEWQQSTNRLCVTVSPDLDQYFILHCCVMGGGTRQCTERSKRKSIHQNLTRGWLQYMGITLDEPLLNIRTYGSLDAMPIVRRYSINSNKV